MSDAGSGSRVQYLILRPAQKPEVKSGPKPSYSEMAEMLGWPMELVSVGFNTATIWLGPQEGLPENTLATHIAGGTSGRVLSGTAVIFGPTREPDEFGAPGDAQTHLPDDTLNLLLAKISAMW